MIAFISSTPHQTWNSILMAKKMFPGEKCDLFLLDMCSNYKEIAQRLRNEDIFEDVFCCEINKFNCNNIQKPLKRKIKKFTYFIGWKYFLKKSVSITKKYDQVFVAVNEDSSCFILSAMAIVNPNLQAYYFEDGANDYIAKAHGKHHGFKKNFARLLGLNYDIGDCIDTTYVISPSCVATNDYILRPIPTIDPDKDFELKAILNRVFSYDPFLITEKSIFLYSGFNNTELNKKSHDIVHNIVGRYGFDKLLFKDHPRLPAEGYEGIRKYPPEKETLWECVSMNNDCSNKVLISVISSAMYIPKLLFNQEPVLVFLFRIIPVFKDPEREKTFYDFIMRLRGQYSDPAKVFIPETEEELFEYLDGIING